MILDPYYSPCPTCGTDAVWTGAPVGLIAGAGGTDYIIRCSRCEPVVDLVKHRPVPPEPTALQRWAARLGRRTA